MTNSSAKRVAGGVNVRRAPRRARRGQSLVEFALVALVFYLLLAAILTFGHALYVAQGVQAAAELGAREISRLPLPANITFDDPASAVQPGAIHRDSFRTEIFDEAYLVIDLDAFYAANPAGNFFQNVVPNLPRLNQQLAVLMIVDRPDFDGDGVADARLMRYPGALLNRTTPVSPPTGATYADWVATQYAVGIPVVTGRTVIGPGPVGGFETIRWVPVIEEIDTEQSPADNTAPNPDPFRFVQTEPSFVDHRGIVALRVNFPFQSAAMSSFRHDETDPEYPFESTLGRPNAADDSKVIELNPGDHPGSLMPTPLTSSPSGGGGRYAGTYGGKFGLGAQGALGSGYFTGGRPVRPYRRVISGQAIFRREVFQD